MAVAAWPTIARELEARQISLGALSPEKWEPPADRLSVGACFVCFARGGTGPGAAGDQGWAAAVEVGEGGVTASAAVNGVAGGPYSPGLLALREGQLLERALKALPRLPNVLLVNATGRDHPRRCGLALHLGAVLEVPSIGVTHRPLIAAGVSPGGNEGSLSALTLAGETVGYWLRTRRGTRPVAVHAAWRTSADTAVRLVLACCRGHRTPEPLRLARELAREARSGSEQR